MTVKYVLRENLLVEDPGIYAAQVQTNNTADLEQIAKRMIELGSTVTMADILAVIEDAIQASESLLLEGNRVHIDGLCELFPRIKGKFDGITDTFDPARHSLDVGAAPGTRIRKAFREQGSVTKEETIKPMPSLLEFVDTGSGTTNQTITTGNIGTINGHRLSFNIEQVDEGVFFIAGDATVTRVNAVQKNKPGQVVFLVPESLAPAGNPYHLRVKARFSPEEDPRTGELPYDLNISAPPP